ncbi:MAG: glutathione peroxidase [Tenericutes bacterium]|nr:glutathione peroxidase [Mycoplasmatota bacterium]
MNLYDIKVKKMSGEEIQLDAFKGKVVLIVNTASKCGFTPQFAGLEKLFEEYKDKDFVILGFPCNQFLGQDPKSNSEILEFCQLNYGVTFPMFEKISVRGKDQHELYNYLIKNSPTRNGKSIKWNFEKFLISRTGEIINRFESKIAPAELKEHIEKIL